jgi:hypothetical protein
VQGRGAECVIVNKNNNARGWKKSERCNKAETNAKAWEKNECCIIRESVFPSSDASQGQVDRGLLTLSQKAKSGSRPK